ncbi:MAG: hypothetical protein HYU66_08890 [Armatimonadetes bacterium]|nr:hypothetical protein [Armatimonadota bacterium]
MTTESDDLVGEDRGSWEAARHAILERRLDDAVTTLRELRRTHPRLPCIHAALGLAYGLSRHYRRARRSLQRAAWLEPGNAVHWFNLARVCGKLGDHAGVAGALRRALKADPRHRKARASARRMGLLDEESLDGFDPLVAPKPVPPSAPPPRAERPPAPATPAPWEGEPEVDQAIVADEMALREARERLGREAASARVVWIVLWLAVLAAAWLVGRWLLTRAG